MPDSFPYIISNNKIEPILAKIRAAARPNRFSRETLTTWGFTASNDRAMLTVLKELGFLTETGAPTEFYDRLRDPNDWKYVLAERIRDLYGELFATDTNIQSSPEGEIKGAISRVTGKDDETVKRYYSTFKTLASLAKFDPKPVRVSAAEVVDHASEPEPLQQRTAPSATETDVHRPAAFHYNLQIHLPVTTDVTVYNAIFRSIRENLGI